MDPSRRLLVRSARMATFPRAAELLSLFLAAIFWHRLIEFLDQVIDGLGHLSSHSRRYPLETTKARQYLYPLRSNLVLHEPRVVGASPHFQHRYRLLDARIDLHEPEQDDRIDDETQTSVCNGERLALRLRRLPDQYRAEVLRLEVPHQAICLFAYVLSLYEHREGAERV